MSARAPAPGTNPRDYYSVSTGLHSMTAVALFIERTDEGFTERATPRFEEITPKR